MQKTPEAFEREFVHDVYARIAPHFSQTRHSPWPQLIKFLKELPNSSLVVDCGCGNGKNMTQSIQDQEGKRLFFIGYDRSRDLMIHTAKLHQRDPKITADLDCHYREFLEADILQRPFRRGIADAVISVAVLHHLSTEGRRKKAVKEMYGLLKNHGGQGFITVWAKEEVEPESGQKDLDPAQLDRHEKYRRKIQERRKKQIIDCDETDGAIENSKDGKDVFVTWSVPSEASNSNPQQQQKELRYYHLFQQHELESLIEDAAEEMGISVKINHAGYERQNWYVVFEII